MQQTLRLSSNLGPLFELGPETIRRHEKGTETALELGDVVRVRTGMLGSGGWIELVAADGRKLLVVSSRESGRAKRLNEPARAAYRAFAAELHRRLVDTGKPIKFIGGLIFKKPYDPCAIPDRLLP